MKKVLVIAVMLATVGCRNAAFDASETDATGVREFVCYTDGVLTERHVGIDSAVAWNEAGGMYNLHYTDGQKMTYLPRRGETCGVETVNL